MDNGAIQSAYDAGVRAYKTHDGVLFYLDTVANYRMSPAESPSFWHALRAYQDAERKKGVPIKIRSYEQADAWRDRHRKGYANVYPLPFFFGSYADNPDLQEYSDDLPYIKVYGSQGQDIAFFTNFRWRAGYPKGGEHV